MERKEEMLKTGCSRILWIVTTILLCIPPTVWAYTEFQSGEHTINSIIEGEVWVFPDASVTMEGEAHIADVTDPFEEGNMYVAGIVDFHAGIVDGFIEIFSELGTVTVYGRGFTVDTGTIVDGSWTPGSGSGTLTGTYENGDPISLLFHSNDPIFLVDTGGGDPAQMIQALIDTVTGMNLQQGIDNSLDAKLDAALGALDDVNQNNDAAAINTLQAFINAVEAQRDSKITSAQADILIADAQAIIDLLST